MKHAVVWIDQKEARIFEVDADKVEEAIVHAPGPHIHRHANEEDLRVRNHPDDEPRFFGEVARALQGSRSGAARWPVDDEAALSQIPAAARPCPRGEDCRHRIGGPSDRRAAGRASAPLLPRIRGAARSLASRGRGVVGHAELLRQIWGEPLQADSWYDSRRERSYGGRRWARDSGGSLQLEPRDGWNANRRRAVHRPCGARKSGEVVSADDGRHRDVVHDRAGHHLRRESISGSTRPTAWSRPST